jgi:hypothetical protein
MSPDLAIAIVVMLDVTLLAALALVMSGPRKLAAHRAAVVDGAVVVERDLTIFGQLDLAELEAGTGKLAPVAAERAPRPRRLSYQQAEDAGMVLEFFAAP